MAMVTLGSIMAPNMNLYGLVPWDAPCKIILPEPRILKEAQKAALQKTIEEEGDKLTIEIFGKRHPDWKSDYEWCFTTEGQFVRYEMSMEFFGGIHLLALDITDWLKQQPDETIKNIAMEAFDCWEKSSKYEMPFTPEMFAHRPPDCRKEIISGRVRQLQQENSFFAHLGKTHLFHPDVPANPPQRYETHYTEEYENNSVLKLLRRRVENNHVRVLRQEVAGSQSEYRVYSVHTIKPIKTLFKRFYELAESVGESITASRNEQGKWTGSFLIRRCFAEKCMNTLDELAELSKTVQPDDKEESEGDS